MVERLVDSGKRRFGLGISGKRPKTLGVRNGALAPCPDTDNCVSSQSHDARHAIAPMPYAGSRTAAVQALAGVLGSLPRTHIRVQTGDYLHAESASAFWGFVDDLEFYFPPDRPLIQVRSAARLGQYDVGVNRKRMETIRRRFAEAVNRPAANAS